MPFCFSIPSIPSIPSIRTARSVTQQDPSHSKIRQLQTIALNHSHHDLPHPAPPLRLLLRLSVHFIAFALYSSFGLPAEIVAPELIGFLLVKRHPDGELLCGVTEETETYCQSEPTCDP
jgi:hypothetical protein